MDMSCSLDVLVSRELPARGDHGRPDPMAEVIRSTQAKIEAAFRDTPKVTVKRKYRAEISQHA